MGGGGGGGGEREGEGRGLTLYLSTLYICRGVFLATRVLYGYTVSSGACITSVQNLHCIFVFDRIQISNAVFYHGRVGHARSKISNTDYSGADLTWRSRRSRNVTEPLHPEHDGISWITVSPLRERRALEALSLWESNIIYCDWC